MPDRADRRPSAFWNAFSVLALFVQLRSRRKRLYLIGRTVASHEAPECPPLSKRVLYHRDL